MHILVLYQYFGTPNGCWSTRFYEFARRWVMNGNTVTIITSPYDKSDLTSNNFISKKSIDGINLVIINSGDSNKYPFYKRVYRSIIFSVISTYYAIHTYSDVLIASSGPITIGFPALIYRFIKRRKYVFEVRDLWPQGAIEHGIIKNIFIKYLAYKFESIIYKNANLIIAASIGIQSSINKRFPKLNTTVITNGSDILLFENKSQYNFPSFVSSKKKIFIYTGSIGLMDSVQEIIDGYLYIKHREDIHIVIIGEGSEKNILVQKVLNYGLEKNIHFLGLIPKTEVVNWYQIAIASFVLFKNYPVWDTVSPNKMFDSFASGVPIIQNTKGWIKDLVDENECGLNVVNHDPRSMSYSIELLANNSLYRSKLGMNAKRLAKTVFNRDILAQKYINSLEFIPS